MANNPNSKEKIATRKAARKASGMSAQKFYVKTRMAEAAKSGKIVDRAALRKKFQSGDVARKGFNAPKKKTGSSGFSSTSSSSTGSSSTGSSPKRVYSTAPDRPIGRFAKVKTAKMTERQDVPTTKNKSKNSRYGS